MRKQKKTDVEGKVYKFNEKSQYELSEKGNFKSSDETKTYGKFSISGQITDITTKNGVPAYEVNGNNL